MPAVPPNVFLRLHKWAARQDENFTTELLVLVLQFLLERDPVAGVRLVRELTEGFLDIAAEEARTIDLRTQVGTEESGRPDVEIRTSDALVWMEVKVEAEIRTGQLEGYRRGLQQSGIARTRLILLTRHPVFFDDDSEKPDGILRWYHVSEWLDWEYRRQAITDPVSRFFCKQFLEFLEARNMTATQVSWQMADGIRALRGLLDMLEEIAAFCKVSAKKVTSWDSIGFQLDRKYWIGVVYDEPAQLRFQTEGCRIDPQKAATVGVGAVIEKEWAPGGHVWRRIAELYSEEIHFYARSRASQMQWLEAFLRESLVVARQIEMA